MAASRGQTPPANLKERIAALQQRSVSPNTHQSAQAASKGLPSPGSGGLRDRIAKFEEKGGVPVPRGSFGLGAPQLAENAPARKRGELYGNRVPAVGVGRPSGAAPLGSRAGSPLPPTDDAPGPRKRCISAGTALASAPPTFSTDEPVPALPSGLPAVAPRRNSLAVDFASGRRVMGAEGTTEDASSLVPEKPPDARPPVPEATVEVTPTEVEPSSVKALPLVGDPPLADPGDLKVDAPPTPQHLPTPLDDASQNVSQPPSTEQSSKAELSDYESAPQSAISPEPAPPVPPMLADVPSDSPKPVSVPTGTVVKPPTPPAEEVATSRKNTNPVPSPTVPDPPSIPAPSPATESRLQSKPTFKAVVHRKVAEPPVLPAASSLAPPETPSRLTKQRRGVSNISVVDVPPSPGGGDLAVLLEDAALLELRLTEVGRSSKANELLETTPTGGTFEPDRRHASASTLTEYAPVPSVDSGSQSESAGSVSIPSIREPLIDGEIPEGEDTDGRSLASTTFSQRSPSHRKYLSNIYRLTSRRSSSYIPGAYPRDSMSVSSEDSSPVTTPSSDNGKRKGFGIAWPSASPKKGTPNVSRSSSFADKIFNRNRTRSNVSTADQASERNSLYGSSQPSLSLAFPSELSAEAHPGGLDMGARPTSWISPGDSTSEFSPTSSLLDKDIFDAFPSVPQTLPPGFHLDAEAANVGRASTLSVNGRKQVSSRLSMA